MPCPSFSKARSVINPIVIATQFIYVVEGRRSREGEGCGGVFRAILALYLVEEVNVVNNITNKESLVKITKKSPLGIP